MNLLFAGSGEFGIPTLDALLNAGHQIVQVISQPDRPAGRGRHLTPTPISQFASQHQLPLLTTADINKENLPDADLLVVIAFGQKIAPHVVNKPKFSAINLHGSRLPKFRGAGPINAAILAGETISGNTVIRIAEKMDSGAMLGQSSIVIGDLETAGELHDRLSQDGAPLMLDVIEKLAAGNAVEIEQDHSQATRAPKLSRQSAKINWNEPSQKIARQIRGMYPWPGCHAILLDESGHERAHVTLVRARPAAGSGSAGSIQADNTVTTGDSAIEIVEIQPEGKRPMPLAAFRNGHLWQPGMRLEST